MRAPGIVMLLCLAVGSAAAQPVGAVGKPLPSPDVPDGTVTVRVLDGNPDAPRIGAEVTLTVDGAAIRATTDELGRVQFEHLAAGATAIASVATKDPLGTSKRFTIPSSGGVRVMLSTKPWRRPARKSSGSAMPVEALPRSSLEVQLTYDDLSDPKPPAGATVSLVGYAADATVRVVQHRTDVTGTARFADLDTTGAVAYFALAQLPRKGRAERLMSTPVLPDVLGLHLVLSAEQRTAAAPPLDDVAAIEGRTDNPATPKGKLRVRFFGPREPSTELAVHDAASGKVVAHRTTSHDQEVLDVPGKPGAIVYVEASAAGRTYRSLPVELVADRGANVTIFIAPPVTASYQLGLAADDAAVVVWFRLTLGNYSWIPYLEAGRLPRFPLPRGATQIDLASETASFAAVTDGVLELTRPLPPGPQGLSATFDLPATQGVVTWSLDLPSGAFKSTLAFEQERGFSIDNLPPGSTQITTGSDGVTKRTIGDIMLPPNQTLVMTIHLPRPGPDNAALHSCRRLGPEPTQMLGQPIDATLARLGGGSLALSSLRGTPVLVNVMATWDQLSATERPQLAALASRVPGLAIVMVASARDPAEVATAVGKLPFPVVLDPPARPDGNIGATTSAWGITAVPENMLVDRKGVVRYHFQNARDWDSPDALRCIRAFMASP